ncbi:MAG: hypothetical protein IKP88_04085 [Lachnospiraceae bacterium]|nr:hypothetical protein [Lachnospiraceae bacterium]
MFKYWIKNRAWITFFWTLLLCLTIGVVFVLPNIDKWSDNYSKESIYSNTKIDYDIPAPTKEQLNEIENMSFVDNVFGYYYTEATVVVNKSRNVNAKIIFSDYIQNLDMTMYSEKRVIELSSKSHENPIYIDYDYKSKNNINLDDTIEIYGILFQVAGIYETNFYNAAIYAPLVGDQKKLIEEKSTCYSGAFINVNDFQQAETYFRNYKPNGRLRTREEFDTEEQYLLHYNAWESANYYNEITRFDVKAENLSKAYVVPWWIILAVVFFVSILVDIVLFNRKIEYPYFITKKYKKDIPKYYKYDFIWQVFLVCLSGGVLYCYYLFINDKYVYEKAFYIEGSIYLGIMIGTSIFTYIINSLLFEKKIKNKNSQA